MSSRPKIFTWHVHGSYLYYLSQANFDIYLPVDETRSTGYIGRGPTFPFGGNVYEIPLEDIPKASFDCILYQNSRNYLTDQYTALTQEQLQLPRIYLEHDPPQEHPTDTKHIVDDPDVLLVHVTHYNKLMWDNNRTPNTVIPHGVTVPPDVHYTGQLEKGIVVVNNLAQRGRRLGLDIYQELARQVPLDLVGLEAEAAGGLGEVLHPVLPAFIAQYRFYFHPIRYTSLGLALLEAMMLGLPVVGLATTELATVIRNGHSGFIDTDINCLAEKMQWLLRRPEQAARMGEEGRKVAMRSFNIERFAKDWEKVVSNVMSGRLNGLNNEGFPIGSGDRSGSPIISNP
ncbi:glycosyltransferase family 4 protein [Chitinophaga agrisoli]|uniref:Glycosyltransferase family 4 protein n=1 Tax=Chitinophaga agrisoli TaxID=2607653 RepID=A0A5B2VKV6_9BACT|nr:glycosyltransferase family 4 protein [Chitinophaga agrisoli]KAA2239250.1 glycosyltransferase family 4 protein [Chitinophaga agrisoli]